MIVAGIDIGTNTLLMAIVDVAEDGSMTVLEDLHEIPRLGAGVDASHMIMPESVQRAVGVLHQYRTVLRSYGNPPVVCVGTSALRDAVNQDEVLWELDAALEETVRVIDGETEARLTYLGSAGADPEPTIICDIGGGSTELVYGICGVIQQRVSLQVGCVRLTERWCQPGPVDPERRAGLVNDIRDALAGSRFQPPAEPVGLVGVAGTPSALATLDLGLDQFDQKRIEGHVLSTSTISVLRDQLLEMNETGLSSLSGIDPRRSDILPSGAAILFEIMQFLGSPEVRVSTRGLRFGAALLATGIST